MNNNEFSNQFDVLYNNIMNNEAPGLNEYEKSVFLTKAQDEIVKNHFNPKSNPKTEGFDDTAKRQADFSMLLKTYHTNESLPYSTTESYKQFDLRSIRYKLPDDLFIIVNETLAIENPIVGDCIGYFGTTSNPVPSYGMMKYIGGSDENSADYVFNDDNYETNGEWKEALQNYLNNNWIHYNRNVVYHCTKKFVGNYVGLEAPVSSIKMSSGKLSNKVSSDILDYTELNLKNAYSVDIPDSLKDLNACIDNLIKDFEEVQEQTIADEAHKEEESCISRASIDNGGIFDREHLSLNLRVFNKGKGHIVGMYSKSFKWLTVELPNGSNYSDYTEEVTLATSKGEQDLVLFKKGDSVGIYKPVSGNKTTFKLVVSEDEISKAVNGADTLEIIWRPEGNTTADIRELPRYQVGISFEGFDDTADEVISGIKNITISPLAITSENDVITVTVKAVGTGAIAGINFTAVGGGSLSRGAGYLYITEDSGDYGSVYGEDALITFEDSNEHTPKEISGGPNATPSTEFDTVFTITCHNYSAMSDDAIEFFTISFKWRDESDESTEVASLPDYPCIDTISFIDSGDATSLTPQTTVDGGIGGITGGMTDTHTDGVSNKEFITMTTESESYITDFGVIKEDSGIVTDTITVKLDGVLPSLRINNTLDYYGTLSAVLKSSIANEESLFTINPSTCNVTSPNENGVWTQEFTISYNPDEVGIHTDEIIFTYQPSNLKGGVVLKYTLSYALRGVTIWESPETNPNTEENNGGSGSIPDGQRYLIDCDLDVVFTGVVRDVERVIIVDRENDLPYYYSGLRTIVPISYTEYRRLMSKPYKEPLKWQAWRLITNTATNDSDDNEADNVGIVEIIPTSKDRKNKQRLSYDIRYVRRPRPILLANFEDSYGENISIRGKYGNEEEYSNFGENDTWNPCELDPILHEEILQRAVELAKVAWAGDANSNLQTGVRSE